MTHVPHRLVFRPASARKPIVIAVIHRDAESGRHPVDLKCTLHLVDAAEVQRHAQKWAVTCRERTIEVAAHPHREPAVALERE